MRASLTLLPILCLLFLTPPAGADWLVTREDVAIETDGPWKVKGRVVIYTDTRSTLSSLRLDEIDLEASEAATANRAAPADAVVQPPAVDEPREPVMVLTNADIRAATVDKPAAELDTSEPKIIMYSTSWCGFCRRARQLLTDLGAEFVEKDIEKSAEARREYGAKVRGSGVPVFDFDGTIVRGYKPDVIKRQVAKLQAAEPE
ncbi:MAG: glutaredoxin family protein [bacterium]|nr:glutaredoxin family protein [bacterium]